jgi:hypothetical protein
MFKKVMFAGGILAVLVAGIAVVALAHGGGSSRPTSQPLPAGTAPPTALSTTTTQDPTLAPGAVADADVTGITQMLTKLGQAMASGQVEPQLQLLHPSVVAHYDAATCRMALTQTDTSAKFEVISVAPASDYAYSSNGKTTVVPNTFAVTVNHTQNGQTQQQVIHVAKNSDGSYSWFAKCGSS